MKSFLMGLTLLAAFATLITLVWGVVTLFKKNHSPQKSNQLMRWRVLLQAIALGIFALLLLIGKS